MTPEPKKNNGTKRLYWILGLIVSAIVIFVFVQSQMSATVANHPKVVKMETTQKGIEKRLDGMDVKLDEILKELRK